MKKISWFKRLFTSWNKIVEYVNSSTDNTANELNSKLNKTLESQVKELRKDKEELKQRVAVLENKVKTYEAKAKEKVHTINDKDNQINSMTHQIEELKNTVREKTNYSNNVQSEINDKLKTLATIEKTFFAKTGNKGKGEMGEMQVKSILERSGLSKDFWTENLPVGNANVEFAIKSGNDGKWIPVDSKVLDAEIDELNHIVIDKKYKDRVKTQAKEIAKYLAKPNTASYGVMVLQSDSILMALYDNFPQMFQETLRDYKVYIASPSSFIQMAWSISQIVDTYERIKSDEKIYSDMMDTLVSVEKFANNLQKTHKSFNVAMDTHMPTITKRHENLAKRLDKTGKLKMISKEGNDAK